VNSRDGGGRDRIEKAGPRRGPDAARDVREEPTGERAAVEPEHTGDAGPRRSDGERAPDDVRPRRGDEVASDADEAGTIDSPDESNAFPVDGAGEAVAPPPPILPFTVQPAPAKSGTRDVHLAVSAEGTSRQLAPQPAPASTGTTTGTGGQVVGVEAGSEGTSSGGEFTDTGSGPRAGAEQAAPGSSASATRIVATPGEPRPVFPDVGVAAERTASPQGSAGIEARVADIERAASILDQVRVHLGPELRQATIRLEPESLGRLTIRVAVLDGKLAAEVRVEQPEALAALERHLPELRAALATQGLEEDSLTLQLGLDDGAADRSEEREAREQSNTQLEQETREASWSPSALRDRLAARITDQGVDTYA